MRANDTKIISVTDLPAYEDEFDIKHYINGLANFIKSCETPLTIAIQGEWGSGKTSIMNMVREQLDHTKNFKYKSIWFNTWQYAQFDSASRLNIMFIIDLIEQVFEGEDVCSSQSLNKADPVKDIYKLLKVISSNYMDRVFQEKTGVNNITNIIANTLSKDNEWDYQKYLNTESQSIRKFKDTFESFVDYSCYQNKYDRIVFFIDDLDRIDPCRAVELMEIIKNYLDCKKCIFVLAIDYDVVIRGVKAKFGETRESKARSFFEKIIQLPFMVPTNYYNVEKYVTNMLGRFGITVNDSELSDNLFKLMKTCTTNNPRAIKRLLNVYALNSMVNCTQGINSTPDFKNILLLGVLGIQLSYPKLYQFVLINAKYLSMTVEGKQVCLLEYITNPEYQDELANTDADIYLYKAPKNIPELYSLKEQLEEAGISDEWDELWGVLETYTKLLKDSKNSIPTGTLEIFINILNLSELSSYGSQKKDVFKRSIPLDYEIYGEKRHADSAIEMYLYVMEKILTKNAAPLDRQQIRDLYTTVDCFYDCSKLIANGNFDGNTEEMVQFIKKKAKDGSLPPSLEGQTVSKFRQGKFVEIGNINAFIGASLSLPLMRNYIKSLLEYFGDSDLFECRYS